MDNRIEILKQLNKLQDKYCEPCQFKNAPRNDSSYCRIYCKIGARFRRLGEKYEKETKKAKRKKKKSISTKV